MPLTGGPRTRVIVTSVDGGERAPDARVSGVASSNLAVPMRSTFVLAPRGRVDGGARGGIVSAPPDAAPGSTPSADDADRIVTIPNGLSVLRLLGVPVFLWLL